MILGLARIDNCYSFDRSVAIPLARVIDRDKGRSIRNVENQTRRTAITAVLVAHSSERSVNSGIKKGKSAYITSLENELMLVPYRFIKLQSLEQIGLIIILD